MECPSLTGATFVHGTTETTEKEASDASMLEWTMTSSPVTQSALAFSAPVMDSPCYDEPVFSLDAPSAHMNVNTEVSLQVGGCRPVASAPDTWRSTAIVRGCDNGPVSAAAYLHLLGESLVFIGHYLQETDKLVCVSTSLSVLLDSLLCTLAPLMSLSSQIPELQDCLEHTVDSTLENVSYLMPGL